MSDCVFRDDGPEEARMIWQEKPETVDASGPRIALGMVLLICALPFLLHTMGVSFASPSPSPDLSAMLHSEEQEAVEILHRWLAGSLTHTFLEWTAVCIAFLTCILAFSQFHTTQNAATSVIGLALSAPGAWMLFTSSLPTISFTTLPIAKT